ncbi:unnamed protein product [Oikopleura dioica]|uniref:Condensin complex subunit 1 C-terminal domain-containing protein n=1 Tax=Oikopleura dioica TaxID=34765 RepID=E4Y6I5_OIKDI|nr:unnamed protein product [Oikopleura dioica]
MKPNNFAFLIEFFGNSTDFFEAPVCIKSFLTIKETDIFEKEALIRSSWLTAYTGFISKEEFLEEISSSNAREVIQKLSNDRSVFVSRQSQLATIALLERAFSNDEEFKTIVETCVFTSSQFLYSLMINIKTRVYYTKEPFELSKKVYDLMSKDQKSARIVELYLDTQTKGGKVSEEELLDIRDEFFIRDHFRIHTLAAILQKSEENMHGCVKQMIAILDDEKEPHIQFLDNSMKLIEKLQLKSKMLIVEFYRKYFKQMPQFFNRKLQFMTIKFLTTFMKSYRSIPKDSARQLTATVFEIVKNSEVCEKLKYPIYLAFGKLDDKSCSPEIREHLIDALEKTENWQSKDSILETFYNWGNSSRFLLDDEFKKRVGDYLEPAIEDENPSVRSSAIRAYAFYGKKDCRLLNLIKYTSRDMSFSVRRMGVCAIPIVLSRLMIKGVENEKLLQFNPAEEGNYRHDLSPILEYKRTEVDNFVDFIDYMIRDDDWEVRKNMVEVIEQIFGVFLRQNFLDKYDYMNKKLEFLAEDHVGAVSKQAKLALCIREGQNRQVDETFSTERLEEILTDIELNLAVLHNDGKLEFSDNEGDDNFADCY